MLDPLPIGEEENRSLKCEMCGLDYFNDAQHEEDTDIGADYYSIEETGRCIDCLEEWGHGYADR